MASFRSKQHPWTSVCRKKRALGKDPPKEKEIVALLLLVVRPRAPSSVLAPFVAMPVAPSSFLGSIVVYI